MIKYILSTGAWMLLSSLACSQHVNTDFESFKITLPEKNISINAPVSAGKSFIDITVQGNMKGYADEIILYSGTVKRHKLHGKWQSWYKNQNLCDSGAFIMGIPDGEWKHWDESGRLLAIRNYDASMLLRIKDEIQRYHPKRVVYPLTAMHSKSEVRARRFMEAGYSFSFLKQKGTALTLQQAVEGNISPGNEYRPVFDHCLHHGLYMNFFSNGYIKDSGFYKNGLRDGIWMHRDANGNSILTGVYKNGSKLGVWKQYDAHDKLRSLIYYNKKGEEEWKKKLSE